MPVEGRHQALGLVDEADEPHARHLVDQPPAGARVAERRQGVRLPLDLRVGRSGIVRQVDFRRTERGVTEDEVRAVARRGDGDVTGGMIGQVLDALKPPRKEES